MPDTTQEPTTRRSHEYPRAAFYLDCGTLEFQKPSEGDERVPIHMHARSNEAVERYGERWYHDFAGMQRGERVSIDYLHDPDQLMGYLDRFEVKKDGLHADGWLIPYGEDDKAREIIYRAQAGVPYEASIFFGGNGIVVEELAAAAKATVNGKTVQGPAVIFRQWPLRSVAVVPWGADEGTRTKLGASDTVKVSFLQNEENAMAKKPEKETADPDKLSDQGQETELGGDAGKQTPPPLPDKQAETPPEPDPRAECKRFIDAFGSANGAKWFADRKTFAEAQQLHAEALAAENADLKAKLANVDRGEATPVSGTPEGGKGASDKQRAIFGDGLAALVAHNEAALGGRK
ncbi:MAG: hypothetical protein JW741_18025 [Sedimentisphaerales bacterium]|nr:hypothetical protein [Sedimentisphaerales bacterium]